MMDGVPFPFVGVPMHQITTVIDVSDFVDAKLRGILCHATQIGRNNRYVETPDEVLNDPWFRQETFALARATVAWPDGVERDLFTDLRQPR